MKRIRSIIFIVAILVVASVTNLLAQGRQENTSSARAAYGIKSDRAKYKTKKKRKAHKNKAKKIIRENSPAYRKRNNWAG